MREELLKLGVKTDTVYNDLFFARVISGEIASFTRGYDFCLYLDKDKYASRALSKHMRLFNSADAIEQCDDKMTTHLALCGSVPMPDTVAGLLCYNKNAEVKDESVNKIADTLGLPVIVKQAYGSMGTGVFKADTAEQLKTLMERFKCEPHLFQRYIASSAGRDLRVIVVGGKVLGGIERKSKDDFRSNIGLGGSALKATVPNEVQAYAVTAAKVLGLDYCGIDFLYGDKFLLCEVNSNAFFDAFEKATDINVAGAYAKHIVQIIDKQQR